MESSAVTLFILENLSLLDRDEMAYLGTSIINSYKDEFLKTAFSIFAEHDSALHQNLMRLASRSGMKDFIPIMEEKLSDADPDSRITSLWCLRELEQVDSLPKMRGLLYDPENTVRGEAASVFVDWEKEETFTQIHKILFDKNESPSVHHAIIKAMSLSSNIRMIPLLVSLIDEQPDLYEVTKQHIFEALLVKQSGKEIAQIISLFESSSASCRKFLIKVFKEMGETVEESLMDLLSSTEDQILKKNISTVLDSTGYVEIQIGIFKKSLQLQKTGCCRKPKPHFITESQPWLALCRQGYQ